MRRATLLLVALLAASPVFSQSVAVYHEVWCPSVDVARMTRMKRAAAEAMGIVPAPDCHVAGMRYLGISGPSPLAPALRNDAAVPGPVRVRTHMRNGTVVEEHTRSRPTRRR